MLVNHRFLTFASCLSCWVLFGISLLHKRVNGHKKISDAFEYICTCGNTSEHSAPNKMKHRSFLWSWRRTAPSRNAKWTEITLEKITQLHDKGTISIIFCDGRRYVNNKRHKLCVLFVQCCIEKDSGSIICSKLCLKEFYKSFKYYEMYLWKKIKYSAK